VVQHLDGWSGHSCEDCEECEGVRESAKSVKMDLVFVPTGSTGALEPWAGRANRGQGGRDPLGWPPPPLPLPLPLASPSPTLKWNIPLRVSPKSPYPFAAPRPPNSLNPKNTVPLAWGGWEHHQPLRWYKGGVGSHPLPLAVPGRDGRDGPNPTLSEGGGKGLGLAGRAETEAGAEAGN
jgi:hypothetical protein